MIVGYKWPRSLSWVSHFDPRWCEGLVLPRCLSLSVVRQYHQYFSNTRFQILDSEWSWQNPSKIKKDPTFMISMISEGEIWMIIRSQKARNIIEVIHGKSMPHLRLHTTFIADRGRPFTDESVTPRGHQKYVFFLVFFGICYVSFLHLWSWSFFGPPPLQTAIYYI